MANVDAVSGALRAAKDELYGLLGGERDRDREREALAAELALGQPRGAVAGGIAAALLVLLACHMTRPAEPWRTPRVTTA